MNSQSILSEASIVPGFSGEEERFVDHEGKRSFKLDHTLMVCLTSPSSWESADQGKASR